MGQATLDDIMQPVTDYNYQYWVITSRFARIRPCRVTGPGRLRTVVSGAFVGGLHILSSIRPRSTFFTDAKLLAYCADATLLVVRNGVTPKAQLPMLDKLLYDRRLPNLHLILNAFESSLPYRYAYKEDIDNSILKASNQATTNDL